jgi:hypothetical protein
MRDQSTDKPTFKCMECGKVVQSQNELQEHKKTHQGQKQGGGASSTHQAGGGQSQK